MADSLPYTRAAASTRKGTNHAINEDAWRTLDASSPVVKRVRRGVLYAVADGVSSTNQGQYAAQMTCNMLEEFFESTSEPNVENLKLRLYDLDLELAGSGRGKAACTLSAIWFFAGVAHVLHVGNSEVLRMREGDLVSLSGDVGAASRRLLKSYMGMGQLEKVLHVSSEPFEVGDVYFLLTDGVREAFPSQGAIASTWVRSNQDPARFGAMVVNVAEEKKVEDDATVVAIQVIGLETIRLQVMRARVR